MKRFVLSAVLCLGLASPVVAKELAGVRMGDTLQVAGKELKLNGLGLRKRFIFDVYVAGLYVENPSKDGAAILGADETRVVKMMMKRDLDKATIAEALRTGFESNAGAKLPELKERLDKFISAIPAVKEKDVLTLMYVPGQGTTVSSKSGQQVTVDGKDFADALFSVFIGAKPVDDGLKYGMLGN
ncbi:MAG: chalcone isomerase family protein [Myxococcaceae bacterium]|nr:chalcone isomerase family protein [Myxococcaceae bacterium]MCI0669663.1 chalcone isomerase family protein [Myxococcaceae bacterium]